jgi:hypothetical protein
MAIDIFKRKRARANYSHNRLFCIGKGHGILTEEEEEEREKKDMKKKKKRKVYISVHIHKPQKYKEHLLRINVAHTTTLSTSRMCFPLFARTLSP